MLYARDDFSQPHEVPRSGKGTTESKEAGDQKDWTKAKKHFEAAIAIYPDYDVAYNGLARRSRAAVMPERTCGVRKSHSDQRQFRGGLSQPRKNLAQRPQL